MRTSDEPSRASESTAASADEDDDRALSLVGPRVDLETLHEPALIVRIDGTIIDASTSVAQLLGYRRSDLVGTPVAHVLRCGRELDLQLRVERVTATALKRGGIESEVDIMMCPDLVDATVLMTVHVREPHAPHGAHFFEVYRDLFEPVSAIALEVAMLERDEPSDSLIAQRSLSRIKRNIAALARLLNDLQDLSALDTGRLVLDCRPVELAALIGEVVEGLVSPADRARVTIEAPVPALVTADPPRMFRVIGGLLRSALQRGAHEVVVVRLDVEADKVVISIIDAGPALAPGELNHMFDRGTNEGDSGRSGTQIALHVARKIIEAHGGRVGAEHAVPHGTRVYCELPR